MAAAAAAAAVRVYAFVSGSGRLVRPDTKEPGKEKESLSVYTKSFGYYADDTAGRARSGDTAFDDDINFLSR